jgi:hypothetical protein
MEQDLNEDTKTKQSAISRLIIPMTYVFLAIHFILNYLGTSILIPFYLFEIFLVIICVLCVEFRKSLIPIFALLFIEGQGRVLMNYNPIFRNIFDFTMAIVVLKSISMKKSIMPISALPHGLIFIIGLHFLWFTLQVFNIFTVGFFPALATSKIYIFPFIIFFMFLNNPLDKKEYVQLVNFIFFIVICECILAIWQMSIQEQSVLSITPFYATRMNDGVFTGAHFRPFGTTHLPGGLSSYLFMSVGLFYLLPMKTLLKKVLFAIAQTLTIFTFFIMQVRVALIKHIIIILGITLGLFLISKLKLKSFISFSAFISLFIFALSLVPDYELLFPEIDFENSTKRISMLQDVDEIRQQRQGGDKIFTTIIEKLSIDPLGLGPGRTGAAANMGAKFIYADPVYNIGSSWSWDNLLVSLIIDFGIGAIFYVSFILILFLKLVYNTTLSYHKKEESTYRVGLVSSVTCLSILIGNWGGIGLPYNPESFIFWFFMALGLNAQSQAKDIDPIVE